MKLHPSIKEEFDRLSLKEGEYLVAFSGGGDSVYLLFMLKEYYQEELPAHISLCYVNYHDSPFVNEEERIVYDYANLFNVKLHRYDTCYDPKKDGNFEDWARRYRYDLFAKVVKEEYLDGLITAHQKTDLVETYLLQKERGNLPSYYGLRDVNDYQGMKIYRPLLSVSKEQLTKELKEENREFYDDITNTNLKKKRNLIRTTLDEELLDSYCKEIEVKNRKVREYQKDFQNYREGMSFRYYQSKDEEYQKRYCFFLLDCCDIGQNREGLGKKMFVFLKNHEAGELELDRSMVLYRTGKDFFIHLDYTKIRYSMLIDKPGIYENRYLRIDLTDPKKFNFKTFPVTIRNYEEGDLLSTSLPTKDIRKALQKQGVPFYLRHVYPVIIKDDKIICVPFYKDILEGKIPLTFHF